MPGETVAEAATPVGSSVFSGSPQMIHVVNLYAADEDGLGAIQERTIETMRAAAAFTRSRPEGCQVDFVSVQTEHDRRLVPRDFEAAPDLARDVNEFVDTQGPRPLPLLFDVLGSADSASSTAEVVVFTNADICLTPSFYHAVRALLDRGFDSLIINRRTVHGWTPTEEDAHLAAVELGDSHPGHDCFVFSRSLIERFSTNRACLGAGHVMRGLLYNLVAHSVHLLVLTEAHLTYHFGNDRPWAEPEMSSYGAHNRGQLRNTYEALCRDDGARLRLGHFFRHFPRYRPPGIDDYEI